MNKQKLMKVTYYDEKNSIRLTGYADTVAFSGGSGGMDRPAYHLDKMRP